MYKESIREWEGIEPQKKRADKKNSGDSFVHTYMNLYMKLLKFTYLFNGIIF